MDVNCQIIIDIFNQCFEAKENTILVGNADEPLYQPSQSDDAPHQIFFTRDYTSSALHEIAHWCLAGEVRRQLVDYGYWYEPDGRTQSQQALFEKVEVKPQAIEKLFSAACGQPFHISADNLNGELSHSEHFEKNVNTQAFLYKTKDTLPPRAAVFLHALHQFFSDKACMA